MLMRFDPPANMKDFDHIKGQRDQWHAFVSGIIDGIVSQTEKIVGTGACQFYNASRVAVQSPILQDVVWSAFPKTLRMRYGLPTAYAEAEKLIPRFPGSVMRNFDRLLMRPHDEYCEWKTYRDENSRITKVVFTSEPPEYWQALAGDTLQNVDGEAAYEFKGDRAYLLHLYRKYVSPAVDMDDLFFQEDMIDPTIDPDRPIFRKGEYNVNNRWNATYGIAHLGHRNNYLSAEIILGCQSTVHYRNRAGHIVVKPDELICCGGLGGVNRTSDPTIAGHVNQLARLGARITIQNPIGLYMSDINLSGFERPDGRPVPEDWFNVLRGDRDKAMIERAEFAVPAKAGYTVSDLRIGGIPIQSGGQIAEHITVKLTGVASDLRTFPLNPQDCTSRCCIDPAVPNVLQGSKDFLEAVPAGWLPAFEPPDGAVEPRAAVALAARARAIVPPRRTLLSTRRNA